MPLNAVQRIAAEPLPRHSSGGLYPVSIRALRICKMKITPLTTLFGIALVLAACQPARYIPPTATLTPEPPTFTPIYKPTFTPNPTAESTQIIVFHPEGVPTQERTGSCWSTSNVLNRVDAWRCIADNSIYDPCFSIPGNNQAVICDTRPLSDSTGFKLNLTESFPARGTVSPVKSAWAFELADGTNCTFMGGATATFEGKRVNYSCSDGWVILGGLQEGQVWTAWKVRLSSDFSSIEESIQVSIKKVWL